MKVLEEKKLPIEEYIFFASAKSKGKKITFLGKEYQVQELTKEKIDEQFSSKNIENFDSCFAIFSAGSEVAKKYAPILARRKVTVIDNSSAFRMEHDVPLVVPEVNPEEMLSHNGIISNPNCSTIQAVVALKPLDTHYHIKRIVYSTYQAVSGAGYLGVMDFQNEVNNFHIGKNISEPYVYASSSTLLKFPYPIFSNCLPHIDVFLKNGYTKEEEKMINETRKILKNPDLKITATTVRVPVLNCHSESINVEFEKEFQLEEAKELLKSSPGIIVKDNQNEGLYPTVIDSSGRDEVFIRKDKKG